MLQYGISGLPVVDSAGHLVGIITEGDFLRHLEADNRRQGPRWLEFLLSPGRIAEEYVRSHGRRVEDAMTRQVVTASEETPIGEVVRLMEQRRIKRVPVMRDKEIVGIVSRANLLRAFAHQPDQPASADDVAIRAQIVAELMKHRWGDRAPIDIIVRNGIVELWGPVYDERVARALGVAAENVPGVRGVEVTALPESAALELH
jgi:predicted transcriptional regulator